MSDRSNPGSTRLGTIYPHPALSRWERGRRGRLLRRKSASTWRCRGGSEGASENRERGGMITDHTVSLKGINSRTSSRVIGSSLLSSSPASQRQQPQEANSTQHLPQQASPHLSHVSSRIGPTVRLRSSASTGTSAPAPVSVPSNASHRASQRVIPRSATSAQRQFNGHHHSVGTLAQQSAQSFCHHCLRPHIRLICAHPSLICSGRFPYTSGC